MIDQSKDHPDYSGRVITVTQEDIEAAIKYITTFCRITKSCPIYQAVKRCLGFPEVNDLSCAFNYIIVGEGKDAQASYRLPAEASNITFLNERDWHTIKPFTFILGNRD